MATWNSLREETWRDVMEWCARIYPDKVAIVSPETNRRCTYQEFNQRTNRLCNAMLGLGLKKGDRLAVLATDIPEYLEIASASKAGFVYVPLNWRLKPAELVYILSDSGARAVFVEERFFDAIRAVKDQVPALKYCFALDGKPPDMLAYDELMKASPDDPGVDVVQNDLLAIVYTSGTTGLPKGVIKKHRDVVRFTRLVNAGQVRNDSRCLGMWPLFHVALLHANFVFIKCGATQYLLQRFDVEKVLKLIHQEKISHLAGAPTMLIRLTEHPDRPKYDTTSLHSIAYAGSPMPVEAIRRGIEAFGPVFHQGFGMTEGTGQTVLRREEHLLAITDPTREKILGSVGKPLPGCRMRIVDDDDKDVPPGEAGEIVFRSDAIIEGYWNKPEETAELLRGGWLHTGDIGKLDADGYLYIVDRKKDLIISGGENIASKEVETVIYGHPAVLECAVIGVPSEAWGEDVKAIVALKEGMSATPEEIIKFSSERLGGFKKPKSVEIWDELPKNPIGKILKREMREKYWAGREKRVH
ncbi:MAG: long-chain-fatty-acid--CoA ligase [Chloroflexota bacterium]